MLLMKKFFLLYVFALGIFLALISPVSAATSPSLIPTATGTYSEWTPNTGVTHYTTVDETPCNGLTDYVATSTLAKRDSYAIVLSSIPNNSVITAIAIAPCASRATTGTGSSVLNVFYRYNGANGSDLGSYAPSGTTPTTLATSTWSSLSLTKTSTSTLEIGMVYTSGTKGGRLSRISTQLTYGQPPSATTSAASSITSSSALLNGTGNPNGTSTTAWFRIATSSPGTCNDTFGTRVPLSGSASLGAGTSSVAYSTTTSSLTQNTTYYYCAVASSTYGKGYGSVQSFLTSPLVTTINTNISSNQTWTTASGTYLIAGAVAVNAGITLTINQGVIVKFQDTSASLTINGTLNANGAAANLIYFTSYKDDSVGGDANGDGPSNGTSSDWGNIKANAGGTGTFNYTTTRYGGDSSNYANFYNDGGILNIATSTIDAARVDGIRHVSGTTTVASSTIKNNTYGIEAWAGGLLVSTSAFSNNSTYAASISLAGGLQFTSHANSGASGLLISGPVSSDQTWESGLPYILAYSPVTINSGVTLTVNPSTIVKFLDVDDGGVSPIVGLIVNGTINAPGSLVSPIYFTSYKDDAVGGDTNGDGTSTAPAAADWGVIQINAGGSGTFNYSTIRYGGYSSTYANLTNNGGILNIATSTIDYGRSYGIKQTSGTTTVASSTISHTEVAGIYASNGNLSVNTSTFSSNGLTSPSFYAMYFYLANGLTFTNHGNSGEGGIFIWGTFASTQLLESGLPYILTAPMDIPSGVTLTINPGAIIKFDGVTGSGPSVGLTVEGTLNAAGSSDDEIYFTSLKDDRIPLIGDTNGDGTSTAPAANDWGSLKVNSGGSATLSYSYLRYGGYSTSKMLYNNGGTVSMDNSEVAYANTGIYTVPGSTLTLGSTTIAHTTYGLYHDGGTTTLNLGDIFENNTTYGIFNGTTATLTATNLYWPSTTTPATSTGPYHPTSNPTGNGDTISDYVDWKYPLGVLHFMAMNGNAPATTSVNSSKEIRWEWATGSTQTYGTQLTAAISTWNARGAVNIISTSSGRTLITKETNDPLFDWSGSYTFGDRPPLLEINTGKLFDNTSDEIQNTWTHELGHALGLGHSYIDNVLYYINSPQTTLGTQDILDYNNCWVSGMGNCTKYQ